MPARAELITYRFDGILNFEWANPDWLLEGEFIEDMTLGSAFSMTLTWDTATPVQSFTAPDTTTYFPAFTALSIIADGYSFGVTAGAPFGQLTVSNGTGDTPDRLSGVIRDTDFVGATWGDVGLTIEKWYLYFPSSTWSSSAIPTVLPSDFNSGGAVLYFTTDDGRQGKVGAMFTNIEQIPEPSALILLAVGLFTAARFARRRSA